MRVLLQRSLHSSVQIREKIVGSIPFGYVLLVGFTNGDTKADVDYLIQKIIHLRIFKDENNQMNRSIIDVEGSILSISQFTLYANTEKGRRPSFVNALAPTEAEGLYHYFNEQLRKQEIYVETGVFGEDMQVSIQNDGPVTMLLESRKQND